MTKFRRKRPSASRKKKTNSGTCGFRAASASSRGIVTTYRYNALEQRIAKLGEFGPIAYQVYDQQGRLLGEYDGNGSVIQETVYLGETPVAVIKAGASETDATGGVHYIHADHLGNNVRLVQLIAVKFRRHLR